MKLGDIEINHWNEVVLDKKWVWYRGEAYNDWVRLSTDNRKATIIDHNTLCSMIRNFYYNRKRDYKIQISGATINIIKR